MEEVTQAKARRPLGLPASAPRPAVRTWLRGRGPGPGGGGSSPPTPPQAQRGAAAARCPAGGQPGRPAGMRAASRILCGSRLCRRGSGAGRAGGEWWARDGWQAGGHLATSQRSPSCPSRCRDALLAPGAGRPGSAGPGAERSPGSRLWWPRAAHSSAPPRGVPWLLGQSRLLAGWVGLPGRAADSGGKGAGAGHPHPALCLHRPRCRGAGLEGLCGHCAPRGHGRKEKWGARWVFPRPPGPALHRDLGARPCSRLGDQAAGCLSRAGRRLRWQPLRAALGLPSVQQGSCHVLSAPPPAGHRHRLRFRGDSSARLTAPSSGLRSKASSPREGQGAPSRAVCLGPDAAQAPGTPA